MYRLCVNSYVVEVNYWSRWFTQEEFQGLRAYTKTTLAQESIRALTPESLAKLQHQVDKQNQYALYLNRLKPYTSDPIKLLFNEQMDSEGAKKVMEKISEDYKVGSRGIGSRSVSIKPKSISSGFTNIEEILINRGIDIHKYSRGGVINFGYAEERIGVYIQSFNIDLKKPYFVVSLRPIEDIHAEEDIKSNKKYPRYNLAHGILNNNKTDAASLEFDTVYLLASVEKKAWLLVEEYLEGFAKPATKLSNGQGYVQKFYVSARKYIVPAKLNIKLENIGYSAWIPFGVSKEFPTFEAATEEIRKRLRGSGLPELKVAFKRETIEK